MVAGLPTRASAPARRWKGALPIRLESPPTRRERPDGSPQRKLISLTREVPFKRRLVNAKFSPSHAIVSTISNLRDTERRFESPDVAGRRPCRQRLMGDRAEHPQWTMGESLTPPCGVSQRQQQIRRLLHRPPHHQHTLRRRPPRGTVGAQLGTRLAGQYGADSAGTGIMDNPAVATTAPPSMTPNISRR
jgi:hypothetical protein